MTEIRRVPVDFDQPLNKVWPGFLMPDNLHETLCDDCGGRGTTASHQWVSNIAALLMLLAEEPRYAAMGRPMHPYFNDIGSYASDSRRPGDDITELTTGLAGRALMGPFGHDSIDNWRATEALIKAAGLDPQTWGVCSTCSGRGSAEAYPGQRAAAEAWEPTEPPVGDGWQAWETVSEGSPISPVFPTRDGLVHWFTTPASIWGARRRPLNRQQAEALVSAGWSPSMVADSRGLRSGDEAMADLGAKR